MRLNYEGSEVVVHSTPLSKVIFETNWRLFRSVYDDMSSGGSLSGSLSLAKMILLDVAKEMKKEDAAKELLNAIGANTFVGVGGEPQLLASANIEDDLKSEIEAKLIFFTLFYHHLLPTQRADWMKIMIDILTLEFTSSNAMEYFSFSTTSTTEDSIIETILPPMVDQSFPI